jgi:hypothetical protein
MVGYPIRVTQKRQQARLKWAGHFEQGPELVSADNSKRAAGFFQATLLSEEKTDAGSIQGKPA